MVVEPKTNASPPTTLDVYSARLVPTLIDRAMEARKRGVSHRKIPFLVGGAALIIDKEKGETAIVDGANYKPMPGSDGPRRCAEEEIEDDAERLEMDIDRMVIVAPHQPDDESRIDLGVTISCVFCRRRMAKKIRDPKSHLKATTQLIFVNADIPTKRVEMTVEDLLRLFKGEP